MNPAFLQLLFSGLQDFAAKTHVSMRYGLFSLAVALALIGIALWLQVTHALPPSTSELILHFALTVASMLLLAIAVIPVIKKGQDLGFVRKALRDVSQANSGEAAAGPAVPGPAGSVGHSPDLQVQIFDGAKPGDGAGNPADSFAAGSAVQGGDHPGAGKEGGR